MEDIPYKSLAMEFIGTFSLLFVGGWSVFDGDVEKSVLIPSIFHGAILGVMVYIGAKISGGHYNPAVTLGLAVTGNIGPSKSACYILT